MGIKRGIFALLLLVFTATAAIAGSPRSLSWSANTESDLAGYKVYWGTATKTAGAWPSFQELLPSLTNVVDVGNVTEWPIHANISPVENQGYCFTVTAYDTGGNESAMGEIVCYTEVADPIVKDQDPQLQSVENQEITFDTITP